MGETGLKVALAGLLHDIGKFAQGCLQIPKQYANDNADQYQPFYNNRHSHIHALYTAAFIEQAAASLPKQFNEAGWGAGDGFINLAAGHHKPETPLQWLITQADRISSGLDRASFDEGERIAYRDFKKTRLLPLFEGLGGRVKSSNTRREDFQYRYPLAPLSAGSIFPLKCGEKSVQGDAGEEYKMLFDTFMRQLDTLQHRHSSIELWAQHFDSLLQTCTAPIPAARVGDVVHDVSLYDHSRTTAAFAAALYGYHKVNNNLDEKSIRDNEAEKFLLVTGDFYGIQDFIFSTGGEMKKFRSKILRGRSFVVSLFSELGADLLCRKLDLSFLSVVLNAAGKFTLLAPNTAKSREIIKEVERTINDWLFTISNGQASLGISVTAGSPAQFHCGRYSGLHDLHTQEVMERKKQKVDLECYGGAMDGYLDGFDSRLDQGLCALCGKRPASLKASKDSATLGGQAVSTCSICRDHVMLGTRVVKGERMMVIGSTEPSTSAQELHQPLFGCYQVCFCKDTANRKVTDVLKIWQVNANSDGSLFSDVTMRPINGYVPLYDAADAEDDCLLEGRGQDEKTLELIDQIEIGMPKTFTHISLKAKSRKNKSASFSGTEAIGVLKADVDNLGLLMSCGLPEQRFTLSRIATLSRQLNSFFTIYLPNLLAGKDEFKDIYTVFAGGDDLFLIGPWNRMASLAGYLKERFAEYVCENKAITFSAGISVHKAHVPVDKLAAAAEAALEQSKNAEGKNSITMFDQTVSWQEFKALLENRDAMQSWLDKGYISSSMMYRFNQLISMAAREKVVLEGKDVHLEELDSMKWRAMFSYSIQRNINTSLKGEARKTAVLDVSLMAGWIDRYGAATRIPLWHLLYDKR